MDVCNSVIVYIPPFIGFIKAHNNYTLISCPILIITYSLKILYVYSRNYACIRARNSVFIVDKQHRTTPNRKFYTLFKLQFAQILTAPIQYCCVILLEYSNTAL